MTAISQTAPAGSARLSETGRVRVGAGASALVASAISGAEVVGPDPGSSTSRAVSLPGRSSFQVPSASSVDRAVASPARVSAPSTISDAMAPNRSSSRSSTSREATESHPYAESRWSGSIFSPRSPRTAA